MTATEQVWEIDGLRLAGLAWGPADGTPVLALHGWMDHADSFAVLAPLLEGCRVVALDLSGQGQSAHRAAHATYNIWDDLPQIAGVLDQLGWADCVLLGHSRGANISALFAAALPERVRAMVSLDALVPAPNEKTAVETLRAFLLDTRSQTTRPPRAFDSVAAYVERRRAQGNSQQVSEALAPRALTKGADGYVMHADRRLFASSAMKLDAADIEAVLRAITCPVLNIWASDGLKVSRPAFALGELGARLIAQYETLDMEGDHHFHLDPEVAGVMAGHILDFLDRHGLR